MKAIFFLSSRQQLNVIFGAAAVTWLLVISFVFYATPSTDDYAAAVRVMEKEGVGDVARVKEGGGPLHVTFEMYQFWTGRWSGMLVKSVVARYFDYATWYPFFLLLIGLISLGGWICLIKAIWGADVPWRHAVGGGLALHALYLCGAPELADTMYWLTGAINYTLGAALALGLLAGIRGCVASPRGPAFRLSVHLGLMLAGITIAGFNEILGLYWVGATGLVMVMAFYDRGPSRFVTAGHFACALLGLAIVILAPGNAVRQATLPSSFSLAAGLTLTVRSILSFVTAWVVDPRLILATVLCFLWPVKVRMPEWAGRPGSRRLRLLTAVWAAGVLLGIAVPSFAIGGYISKRALTVPYLWFMVGWFLLTLVYSQTSTRNEAHRGRQLLAALLLALAMLTSGNARLAVNETLSGAARRQFTLQKARIEHVRQAAAAGRTEVLVQKVPKMSQLLRHRDSEFMPDPEHRANGLKSLYFGVETIREAEL